jgi:hypothetical protein
MKKHAEWRKGKGWNSVVSDILPDDAVRGSDNVEAYGGYLIAESIAPSMIPLISAAPDLLYALVMVRDADEDCKLDGLKTIPPIARATVDAAIAKAEGRS